jgi:hypothetical protein
MGDRRSSRIQGLRDPDPPTQEPPTRNNTITNDIEERTTPDNSRSSSMPSSADESYNLESDSYNERIAQARSDLTEVLNLNHSHSVSSEQTGNQ